LEKKSQHHVGDRGRSKDHESWFFTETSTCIHRRKQKKSGEWGKAGTRFRVLFPQAEKFHSR